MVLAAGLGTRLRPLTHFLPKPLFPVLNQPLLLRILQQLENRGFERVVFNSFHLSDALLEAVASWSLRCGVTPVRETMLLGTGGGLRHALPYFDQTEPFLVINSDVVTEIDFAALVRRHIASGVSATLVVHRRAPWNKLRVHDGLVKDFSYEGADACAFTGISVLSPAFVATIPEGREYSLIEAIQAEISRGGRIAAVFADLDQDFFWEDIGSPAGYLRAHEMLLARGNPAAHMEPTLTWPSLDIDQWAVVGPGASIGDRVRLRRCVVWDGAVLPAGSDYADCLITPHGCMAAVREA